MAFNPPDYLNNHLGLTKQDSFSSQTNPLLMPFDGGNLQKILLNFQDATSYLSNDNSKSFVGKVYGMCTEKEHHQKIQMNTANDLERGSNRSVNPNLTLKSFQRSDAFRKFKPEDVRPSIWCRRTVYYALCYFADCDIVKKPYLMDKNFTFLDIYNFLRDRLRSIWQDLTVQRCTRHRGYIECFEISIRFLIYSNEVLCESDEYDSAQNMLLLNTCLDKLMDGYSDVRLTVDKVTPNGKIAKIIGDDPNFTLIMNVLTYVSPHEAEFWSYRLLLLTPQILTPGCSATFCDTIQRMPPNVKNSKLVRFSISACLAASSGNICLYFKLMNSRDCHPLQAALMNRFAGCIRVRFLHTIIVNKIVKDSTNPFNFETLKSLMGYENEPDKKFISFLLRYGVKPKRSDTIVSFTGCNVNQLIQDNSQLVKVAGKTQITSNSVTSRFSSFSKRQLIFDPDFKTPNEAQGLYPQQQKNQEVDYSGPLKIVHKSKFNDKLNIFNTDTRVSPFAPIGRVEKQPQAQPIFFRSDTFGTPSSDVLAQVVAETVALEQQETQTPRLNIFENVKFQEQQDQSLQKKQSEVVDQSPRFSKTSDIRRVEIFRPKLNEQSRYLYFDHENPDHFKKLKDLSRVISQKIFNMEDSVEKEAENKLEAPRVNNVNEKAKEVLHQEMQIKFNFDKFESDKLTPGMGMNHEKNYLYLNLNASFYYLESELNRYLNKKASQYVLYSLHLCTKCNDSKLKTKKTLIRVIRRLKRTKSSISRVYKGLYKFIHSPRLSMSTFRRKCSGELKDAHSEIGKTVPSKKLNKESLKSYIESHIKRLVSLTRIKKCEQSRLSPFNSMLSLTHGSIESVIRRSKEDFEIKRPGIHDDPLVWSSGIFVHVSFFDLNRGCVSVERFKPKGSGLLYFKDHVKEYNKSAYCYNLRMDIMNICGFSIPKEDLITREEGGAKAMFQLMACKIPYTSSDKSVNCEIPISLNVSIELKSEESINRVKYSSSFGIKPTTNIHNIPNVTTYLDNNTIAIDNDTNAIINTASIIDKDANDIFNKSCTINTEANISETNTNSSTKYNFISSQICNNRAYFQMNRTIELNGNLYEGNIEPADLRYGIHPQIVVFACSRPLRLPDEDLLCRLGHDGKSITLRFDDKLPVLDSLSLLSYLMNNRSQNDERTASVSCIVCYRLSISKLDMLTLFKSCTKSGKDCSCRRRCCRKVESLLSAVNRTLMISLIENAVAFNIADATRLISNSVAFACVGFEFENLEGRCQDMTFEHQEKGVENVQVSRILYEDGFKLAFANMYYSQLKAGHIRLLQKPVILPDLNKFMVDLLMHNEVKLVEMEKNPQGIMSNALQRFISRSIIEVPERAWQVYSTKYKENTKKRKLKLEGDGYERVLSSEYSKNSFVVFLMTMKEYIRETDHKFDMNKIRQMGKLYENTDTLEKNELIKRELGKYMEKVLECFKIRNYLVPYSVSEYLTNICNFK